MEMKVKKKGEFNLAKMLIIVAHPDDEILGCGGTIAKDVIINNQCAHIGYLSLGATSRNLINLTDFEKLVIKEQSRAAIMTLTGMPKEIVGEHLRFADYPDNKFDTVPLLDIVKTIESWIEDIEPDLILTHSQKDLNIDHQITNRAVLTATRPIRGKHLVSEIYTFPIPSSTEWAFSVYGTFAPNIFIDITGLVELKIEALRCYEAEIREFPHPRSPEYVSIIARQAGAIVAMNAAESYELIRGFA